MYVMYTHAFAHAYLQPLEEEVELKLQRDNSEAATQLSHLLLQKQLAASTHTHTHAHEHTQARPGARSCKIPLGDPAVVDGMLQVCVPGCESKR